MNSRSNKIDKIDSKDVGLEIGLLIGRFFLKTDDLHYGYWPDDLESGITNFAQAQVYHSDFIISHIPTETKTILDVGAGAGNFAQKLLNKGYQVDCISPSPFLTNQLQEKLGENCHVYNSKYEDFQTAKQFDLILFSESFGYVSPEKAIQQSQDLLNTGGYLLICDFFKTDAKGKTQLGGGHKLSQFYQTISNYQFENIKDIDITKETAPTIQMLDDFLNQVASPVRKLAVKYLDSNYPSLMKILKWKFRKRISKLDRRYFTGKLNTKAYRKYKSYRLLLYRKTGAHL